MIRAQLKTSWAGSGFPGDAQTPADPYRPQIGIDYGLANCMQVDTASPPTACTVTIECTADVWTAIQADPKYNTGILWSETI